MSASERITREHIIGVVVSEITIDIRIAVERVMANSRKSRPIIPPISSKGMKTAISEILIEKTVKPISCAPFRDAWIGVSPASTCREMFSITTIASSTTNPLAIASAISDKLSSENPHRYITVHVPISDTGTATAGTSVAGILRRKRNTTRITSMTEMMSVISISWTDARIVSVRSRMVKRCSPAGIDACSEGIAALMASTVEMILAPGCR